MIRKYVKVLSHGARVTIDLGRQGEYNIRQIIFDMSEFVQDFGEGIAVIVHSPDGGAAYTVPPTLGSTYDSAILVDNNLVWTIGQLATQHNGSGTVAINWFVADGLKKSIRYKTLCKPSINNNSESISAQQSYIDQMTELAAEMSEAGAVLNDIRVASDDAVNAIRDERTNAVNDIRNEKEDAVTAVRNAARISVVNETLIYGGA